MKLDGVWYNADITYDAGNIKNKKMAYWLLRSDKDFLTDIDGKSFLYETYTFEKTKYTQVFSKCSL